MKTPKLETGQLNLETQWGPFSLTYLGVSNILDAEQGTMADLALYVERIQPAAVVLPDNIFDYTQHMNGDRRGTIRAIPEDVRADYSSYALRYYLDPHGDTAVARFTVESDERARCEITFHNTSHETREYRYGLGISVADARRKVRLKESLRARWIPAQDYAAIDAYQKVFGLGSRQCLTRVFSWAVEEAVLAQAFGGWSGDRVTYRLTLPEALRDGHLYLRYVKYGVVDHPWEIRINGQPRIFRLPQTWAIPGGGWGKNRDACEEWRLARVPIGPVPAGDVTLDLSPIDPPGNDRARIWLDGILWSEGRLAGDDGTAATLPTTLIDAPLDAAARVEVAAGSSATFRMVVPNAAEHLISLTTDTAPLVTGNGTGSFLACLRRRFGLPAVGMERDSTVCPWGTADSGPISVPAASERTVRFTVEILSDSASHPPSTIHHSPSRSPEAVPCSEPPPAGPFADMVSHLRDALLFNVNYPLTLFGRPSPYFVPSKYFSIPYSWDGGFAAVGLATFAPELACQQAAFFMAEDKYDFPMVYCGSPVPTPLYAMWDVYQATQSREFLASIYKQAKRMYDFYLGRTPGSIVHAAGNGLLNTYPYNYNLGIDDHPIQRWAEEQQLTRKGLYSIILLAQILRLARMMRNAAMLLEHDADAEQHGHDADLLADVVDGRMWDEKSGLYGWLCQTDRGVERVVLDGCSGDRSACAFLPLFAGQTAHKQRLIEHMMDPAQFRTPYGISSVDMSAPYYNPHGYWNGAVWPVMQWYLWHGLLEAGEPALARQIAMTILSTWQDAFTKDHYLGEHFVIARAEMMGAPNFGGLHGSLLPMHAAYFTAYQVTTLYDVVVLTQSVDSKNDVLRLSITAPFLAASTHDLLVNMGRTSTRYAVHLNGRAHCEARSDEYGHLTVRLPRPVGTDEVRVEPA